MKKDSLLNLEYDGINRRIVEALKFEFEKEMKSILMEAAEKQIDEIVCNLSERMMLKSSILDDFALDRKTLKLDWVLTRIGDK